MNDIREKLPKIAPIQKKDSGCQPFFEQNPFNL